MTAQGSQATASLYGPNFGRNFGAKDSPFVRTRTLQGTEVAVTELRVTKPLQRLSDPMPRVDAYTICLMLHELPDNAYWEDGRQVSAISLQAGETTIQDLKREPMAMLDKRIHSLIWYLPYATLNAVADEANVPRIGELHYKPGVGALDATIQHIALTLLPALRMPGQVVRLFTDYAMLAFAVHIAQTYGEMRTVSRPPIGGLASWQEKRAKEMLASDLTGKISLREVAMACELSVSHFSRAFHKSTGFPPHAWLLQARVELAKTMLRKRDVSLSEITKACGFADQSHFARVFTRRIGLSPRAWRKVILD
jgi:AraC family transcriptional regulator